MRERESLAFRAFSGDKKGKKQLQQQQQRRRRRQPKQQTVEATSGALQAGGRQGRQRHRHQRRSFGRSDHPSGIFRFSVARWRRRRPTTKRSCDGRQSRNAISRRKRESDVNNFFYFGPNLPLIDPDSKDGSIDRHRIRRIHRLSN